MESLKKRIESVKNEFLGTLKQVADENALEAVRVNYLGRNGQMATLMDELKKLSVEEKREIGPLMNELKQLAQQAFDEKKESLTQAAAGTQAKRTENFDVTILKEPEWRGSLHIYSKIINRIEDIFISMGYDIADGPEIETEYYNFDALNLPGDHPARDMYDTIWISDVPNMLLRTHTSPVQIRTMEERGVPLQVVIPGRCYRFEATDATHDFMFTQLEALVVGKNITIANLLATAQTFGQAFFEKKDLNVRVIPSYFPFVEPGLDIMFSCPFCTSGCSICKKTGWIEIGGAGLVHPHVLRCGGLDPDIYTGFAWGLGIERLAMLRNRIPDIRLFHTTKVAVLDKF